MAIETARRQILTCCLPLAWCALAGCKHEPDLAGRTEEETTPPAAVIQVADPRAAPQLVSGWYGIEQNAWRWTARKFAAILGAPIGAARSGAVLRLDFTLPDVVVSRLGSVTLSASVQGAQLAPETYRRPGKWVYQREVPVSLFTTRTLRADFALDKALPPGGTDLRELGVIVDRVSLATK